MAPVELVESSLRHGQQALLLSRLRLRHALPVVRLLDRCGFAALDVFGGTTFEASLRFLAENPFDRLRAIREAAPSTPLLATIAGRALVGHRPAADDVIDAFVRVTSDAGIDIFRCLDPLNDVGNLERCLRAVHAAGRTAEGVICYTEADVESLAEVASRLAGLGFDSLCLHDPLGLPGVARARETVGQALGGVSIPMSVSFSAQTGQAGLAYWGAAEAGAGRLDVALAPLAGGASLPPAEALIAATMDTEHRTGLDVRQVAAASDALDEIIPLYQDIIDPTVWRYDHAALRGRMPASSMPHALAELRDRGEMNRFEEVEQEITRVRSELGYPPLVPPVTEIIATQAVYNVCAGDRYATVSREFSDYCLGLYGTPPEPIDPSVRTRVQASALGERPLSMSEARQALAAEGIADPSDEAAVCYALFPTDYLALIRGEVVEERLAGEGAEATPPSAAEGSVPGEGPPAGGRPAEPGTLTVEVDGQPFTVRIIGGGFPLAAISATRGATTPPPPGAIVAPMAGMVVSIARPGQVVSRGEVVAVIEAMKMQNEVVAPEAGTVREVRTPAGATVAAGHVLLEIG